MMTDRLNGDFPILTAFILGCICCFFGHRFVKFQVIFSGIVFGFAGGAILCDTYFTDRLLFILIGGIIGCVLGGIVFKMVFHLALFSIGLSAGLLLAPAILSWTGINEVLDLGIFTPFLLGILAGVGVVLLQRPFLIVFTSTIGAFSFLMSLHFLLNQETVLSAESLQESYHHLILNYGYLVIGLIGLGIVVQLSLKGEEK